MTQRVSADSFYRTYHGHRVPHLTTIETHLRATGKESLVYLAGDSSLDSKYWFTDEAPACNGYETILAPPTMRQDICYHLNRFFSQQHGSKTACINAAVEEATLQSKSTALNAQDLFIRDTITENDVLFVNIGGNDIALAPSFGTIVNMLKLLYLNSTASFVADPANAWGMPHFIELFRDQMRAYVEQLIARRVPRKIVISLIYFPDEKPSGGWADRTLGLLGYFKDPSFLQTVIRAIFDHAVRQIRLSRNVECELVTFPMFSVLDGKRSEMYCQGVEPSARGNAVLANAVFPLLA